MHTQAWSVPDISSKFRYMLAFISIVHQNPDSSGSIVLQSSVAIAHNNKCHPLSDIVCNLCRVAVFRTFAVVQHQFDVSSEDNEHYPEQLIQLLLRMQ